MIWWLFGRRGISTAPSQPNQNSFLPNDGAELSTPHEIAILVYSDGVSVDLTPEELEEGLRLGTLRYGWRHRRVIRDNEFVLARVYYPTD